MDVYPSCNKFKERRQVKNWSWPQGCQVAREKKWNLRWLLRHGGDDRSMAKFMITIQCDGVVYFWGHTLFDGLDFLHLQKVNDTIMHFSLYGIFYMCNYLSTNNCVAWSWTYQSEIQMPILMLGLIWRNIKVFCIIWILYL